MQSTTKIGQSNTDFRALSDEDLALHIAMLAIKRPHNWTPTFRNLRGARQHMLARIGARRGFIIAGARVRAGDEVMADIAGKPEVTYTGRIESVTPQGFTIEGPSPYGGAAAGRTFLRPGEIAELVVL